MDTSFGIQRKGKRNLITDVAGITVGHCTLADGDVQTGVTVLLPHQGDLFHDRCPAAVHVNISHTRLKNGPRIVGEQVINECAWRIQGVSATSASKT